MSSHDHTVDIPHSADPITGEKDFHPVATGVGAAAGGMAAGAAIGTVVGPVGTALGAAAGAIIGGLAGKAVAHRVEPHVEEDYWQANYKTRPYVTPEATYDDYGPAYRYGVNTYEDHIGRDFEDVDSDLGSRWESVKGQSSLSWDKARHATRDSWQRLSDRVERAVPGDSDHDGK